MRTGAVALFGLALAAGCDNAVRVSLVLGTGALSQAQRDASAGLAIEAFYDGHFDFGSDVTKRVALDGKALVDPERIELRFPDATRSVSLDVRLLDAFDATLAEVKSPPRAVSHGLTEIALTFSTGVVPGDMGIVDLGSDMAARVPFLRPQAPISVGAATAVAIVGKFEGPNDELVVATSGGIAYKLPHLLSPPYLGAAVGVSLSPIAMQPAFGVARGQLAAGAAGGGQVCLYPILGGGSACDVTGGETINAISGGVAPAQVGQRTLVAAATSSGLDLYEPAIGPPIQIETLAPATAVLLATLDGDDSDIVYASSIGVRICHKLAMCVSAPGFLGKSVTALAAVDLDGDGLMDLFAFEGTLGHFLRNEGGTPAQFVEVGALTAIGSPVFGDFNDDGFPDLAYITSDKLGIVVATLQGTTTPVATPLIDIGAGLFSLHTIDLDGKAPLDLVVVDTTGKVTPIVVQ